MKKIFEGIQNFLEIDLVFPRRFMSKIAVSVFLSMFIFLFILYYVPFGLENPDGLLTRRALELSLLSGTLVFLILLFVQPFIKNKAIHFTNQTLFVLMFVFMILNYLLNLAYFHFQMDLPKPNINFNYLVLLMDVVCGPLILITNVIDWEKQKLIILDLKIQEEIPVDAIPSASGNFSIVNNDNKVLLEVNKESIVAAFSNENYSEVYVSKNNEINKFLLRITFAKLFDQLSVHPEFIRCHRTRIVNLKHVSGIVNDGGNILLRLNYFQEAIAVSKNYPIERHFPSLQANI